MSEQVTNPMAEYIYPLNMNRLKGRMLRLPPPTGKRRELLLVYGHHSSLERWWNVAQALNRYGGVTVPDLPGFGGMDSFYKIGKKPTIDNLADYLASFIKLRYKRKRLTIVGVSFGLVVATRMLQRYPDLVKKVDLVVSIAGFAHRDDFVFSKPRYWAYRFGASCFAHRLTALFFKGLCLNPLVLRGVYARTHNARHKFQNVAASDHKALMDQEVQLWHRNDVRTHMFTAGQLLKVDNCKQQVRVPLWHIAAKADPYFDNHVVEQHLQIIYADFHRAQSTLESHCLPATASIEASPSLLPRNIGRILKAQNSRT